MTKMMTTIQSRIFSMSHLAGVRKRKASGQQRCSDTVLQNASRRTGFPAWQFCREAYAALTPGWRCHRNFCGTVVSAAMAIGNA